MTGEQFVNWVHGHVETWRAANYASLPTFYENAEEPELDTVGPLWLDVLVSFVDTNQATVGSRPLARDIGTVKLMIYAKQGEATQARDQVRDSLFEYFRTNNRATGVVLNMPRKHSAPPALGWSKSGLLVPFTNDQS